MYNSIHFSSVEDKSTTIGYYLLDAGATAQPTLPQTLT